MVKGPRPPPHKLSTRPAQVATKGASGEGLALVRPGLMRRVLYLTPYFPPQSRVGALRPLKFARHLPTHGWVPIVLCDLKRRDPLDPELLSQVPTSTVVVRDYGITGRNNEAAFLRTLGNLRPPGPAPMSAASGHQRRPGFAVRPFAAFDRNPELIPLGEHSLDVPHAVRAARRLLARYRCDAILVNADPWAATLVGRRLAHETGLPLVLDLRDPWAPCELRRPMRPPLQRRVVDYLERTAVEAAAQVILNTDTSCEAYRDHYRDLPEARFCTIRNHSDPGLIAGSPDPPSAQFTVLFLGNLRRFIESDTLLLALGALRQTPCPRTEVRLRIVGRVPAEVLARARELGVHESLSVEPPVSYSRIGGIMHSADLLVAVSHAGRQRIPAKLYDYLTTPRPILALSDNPELATLLGTAGEATVCPRGDVDAVRAAIAHEVALGRQRTVARTPTGTDSASATARLARILDEVTGAS